MTKIQTYNTDKKRLDIPKLENVETCKEYQDRLEDGLYGSASSKAGETDTDQEWEIIKQTIIDSATEMVGYMEKRHRNEWFDEVSKQEMNKKNEAYNNFLKKPTRAKRINMRMQGERQIIYIDRRNELI
jgi:hypothetical protein